MYSPRNLMIAGVVLIAIALGASGHGFWWLFGLFWMLPHAGRYGHLCGGANRARGGREQVPEDGAHVSGPDPTRDSHEAFPAR